MVDCRHKCIKNYHELRVFFLHPFLNIISMVLLCITVCCCRFLTQMYLSIVYGRYQPFKKRSFCCVSFTTDNVYGECIINAAHNYFNFFIYFIFVLSSLCESFFLITSPACFFVNFTKNKGAAYELKPNLCCFKGEFQINFFSRIGFFRLK